MKTNNLMLHDVLFNVIKPNKLGDEKGLVDPSYVIDLVTPVQLEEKDNMFVIKRKLIMYGFDAKKLKQDQSGNFITYINQDWIMNYGYEINDAIYKKEKGRLDKKNIDFYLYSKYLNCNNDQQLYHYFKKMTDQMSRAVLESIKQIN